MTSQLPCFVGELSKKEQTLATVCLFHSMLNTPNQTTSYLKIRLCITKIRLAKSKICSNLVITRTHHFMIHICSRFSLRSWVSLRLSSTYVVFQLPNLVLCISPEKSNSFLEWQPCHSSVMVLCSTRAIYLGFRQW